MLVLILIIVVMVMMLVFILVLIIVVMVMMLVFILVLILVMMMVVMLMLVLILILVVMVMMLVFILVLILVVMVMMLVLILFIRIIFEILHDIFHICGVLHGFQDLLSCDVIPGRGDDPCIRIVLADLRNRLCQLLLRYILGTAEHHSSCCLDLIQEELTEVLHVYLCLGHVYHSSSRIQLQIHCLSRLLNGLHHVGQLADSGGLDDDPCGMVLLNHLLQGLTEISHQGAADTAGVQLIYDDAGFLQEPSVDTDLTKFILDQDHLLTGEGLLQKFLDQCCFPGA